MTSHDPAHDAGHDPGPLRVLVVEDDPVAAEAHAQYVDRVPGFRTTARAHSRAEALRALETHPAVDLILLDLYLPDGSGLALLRSLRAAGHGADVFAVTSARDLAVVREGISLGIVQHVLKPFTFRTLSERLRQYAEFRTATAVHGEVGSQDEVDRALSALRAAPRSAALPKGLSAPTLTRVTEALRAAGREGLTASTAAERVGVNRVTARRYLEHLADAGDAVREQRYGQVGRPETRYVRQARH
ncbi:response regulator [Streptomyces boncukensis]|uniref:Transcriptional regulatory protein n=1 Tax=Streptomyces boncukensis TaxID=2711219 RepID=A0A6G4X720_9ACTN|nr:response regulator [Streptomyces boncukensis]NGO73053.1 response regulator [Streptomyces boncukensis]